MFIDLLRHNAYVCLGSRQELAAGDKAANIVTSVSRRASASPEPEASLQPIRLSLLVANVSDTASWSDGANGVHID